MVRRCVGGAVLLMAVWGCTDPTSPSGPEGTYRLVEVGNQQLPVEVYSTFDEVTHNITTTTALSGSMELRSDGTWELEYIVSRSSSLTGLSAEFGHTWVGTWSMSGSVPASLEMTVVEIDTLPVGGIDDVGALLDSGAGEIILTDRPFYDAGRTLWVK
jgi:hypothetical protein